MFKAWYDLTMLAAESQAVIALRLIKLSQGGAPATTEAWRMTTEKASAFTEAAMTIMTGGGMDKVVRDARLHVRKNARRLRRT